MSYFSPSPGLMNQTSCQYAVTADNPCSPPHTPWYYSPNPSLLPGMSDTLLSVAAPILAYWTLSLFFHVLDISGWKWLEKYRIHDSAEAQSRNRASRKQVVGAVVLQQIIQTALGLYWMTEEVSNTKVDHEKIMEQIHTNLLSSIRWTLGERRGTVLMATNGPAMVYFVYWWGIPMLQFIFGMFFLDTWQYFLHRFMHVNKFLYKHIHSVHHRLYVPYAFGSLYNHPIEGFLLDSLGAVIAQAISGMTVRQAALLFSFSTFKTVDDHCGYSLPFDPFQMISGNTADYHDIHHQTIGIKYNFSQPFFIHWDVLLGTRLARKDVVSRRESSEKKIL